MEEILSDNESSLDIDRIIGDLKQYLKPWPEENGDKYAFISMHENILFSYYEEPRNNVNIKKSDEESAVIGEWLNADPESHFDRVKAQGNNFLVVPCLFSMDRVDLVK